MTQPSPQQQRRARIFVALFAGTFITSIAALILYDPVLNQTDYFLGSASAAPLQLDALL